MNMYCGVFMNIIIKIYEHVWCVYEYQENTFMNKYCIVFMNMNIIHI